MIHYAYIFWKYVIAPKVCASYHKQPECVATMVDTYQNIPTCLCSNITLAIDICYSHEA